MPKLPDRGGRQRQHDHDDDQCQLDIVAGEEDRRPAEVQRQLGEEEDQRGAAAVRRRRGEDQRQRQPEQHVEHGPGEAEHPAGRHEAGLLEHVEPIVPVARVRQPPR